jgi:hypothetical protein
MGTILIDLSYCGARQQTTLRPRMHHAMGIVVAVEDIIELWMKGFIGWIEVGEYEGLEKPAHMGDMPLRRTGLYNGLDLIVIILQW